MEIIEIIKIGIILLMVDGIYLRIITPQYKRIVRKIQGEELEIDIKGAIKSYIFLIIGYKYFIENKRGDIKDALILGMVIYGVFDGTMKAIIKDYPWRIAIIDTIWGSILYALVYIIKKKIDKKIERKKL